VEQVVPAPAWPTTSSTLTTALFVICLLGVAAALSVK
jgi:hypothetical protein